MEEERMEESMIDNKGRLVAAVRVLRVCDCWCGLDMVSNFFLFSDGNTWSDADAMLCEL